jgi:DNA-binding GntR family transcriptional regulator
MVTTGMPLTRTDAVVEWLRARILSGALPPGTQLNQRNIAAALSVSPTPVREAFGTLEVEGFLERRPHRGAFVSDRSMPAREESYVLRTVLESWAIRNLGPRIDEALLSKLDRATAASARALKRADLAAFRRAANGFHFALVDATGSATLIEIVSLLDVRSMFYPPLDREAMVHVQREHLAIAAALRTHAMARAMKVFERHMYWSMRMANSGRGGVEVASRRTTSPDSSSPRTAMPKNFEKPHIATVATSRAEGESNDATRGRHRRDPAEGGG